MLPRGFAIGRPLKTPLTRHLPDLAVHRDIGVCAAAADGCPRVTPAGRVVYILSPWRRSRSAHSSGRQGVHMSTRALQSLAASFWAALLVFGSVISTASAAEPEVVRLGWFGGPRIWT